MRLVYLESPYGNTDAEVVERNVRYAIACMRDCLQRGEAPFASHLLYTREGILDDRVASERKLGMDVGFAWAARADATVVYEDLGISEGMQKGIDIAGTLGRPVEHRVLGPDWDNLKIKDSNK